VSRLLLAVAALLPLVRPSLCLLLLQTRECALHAPLEWR
jgi:hypothetical protein